MSGECGSVLHVGATQNHAKKFWSMGLPGEWSFVS